MKKTSALAAFIPALILFAAQAASAWDYEGHRAVNQLALAALPTNFPAFALTPEAKERIAFLAGEADRWRNQGDGRNPGDDLTLAHFSSPDHFLDLEDLEEYGIAPETAPAFRYDVVAKIALARAAHPEKFEQFAPDKNKDHSKEYCGFAPWAITEYCGKLRAGFSYLKAFQEHGGTPEEIANAQADILYIMGVMGHFVGDCAQPLHVTKHHHGWVGENPKGFSTEKKFHGWIDGGFFGKDGGTHVDSLKAKIRTAKIVGDPLKQDDLFRQVMNYIVGTHALVEPVYQLEKDGKLSPGNGKEAEGREFLGAQLVRGGQMLGDLWFSAWQQAREDTFLIGQLKKRAEAGAAKAAVVEPAAKVEKSEKPDSK